MVQMHRAVLASAGPGPAVVLDTSYGFQENADALTAKAQNYFLENVGREITAVQWREKLEGSALDEVLTAVRTARAVYAGPGSPSYASRVWVGSGFAESVAAVVRAGGTASFSSAAAIATGVVAMPTHEIYRGGADPHWVPGTDLLGLLTGIQAAVIPHYDLNPKNGSHDTRCCYIGERRMRQLELQLPADTHLIGIDEHTALIIELSTATARVFGRGGVTVRVDGHATVLPSGSEVPLSVLNPSRPQATVTAANSAPVSTDETGDQRPACVRTAVDHAYDQFGEALGARDTDAAASIMLRVEKVLSDSTPSRTDPVAVTHARRILRGMMLELADAAAGGLSDPSEVVAPLVSALLEQRSAARQRRDYASADLVRDQLANAGIEVRDSSGGSEWSLKETDLARPRKPANQARAVSTDH
jgi:cyanophycinase-like exopeptidase